MVSSLDYLAFILNYAMRLGVIGQLITRIVIYLIIFAATALIVRRRGRADLTEAFDKFPPVASLMIYAAFLAAYYSVTVSLNADYSKETANALTMLSSVLIVGCIAYLVTNILSLRRESARWRSSLSSSSTTTIIWFRRTAICVCSAMISRTISPPSGR